MEEISHYKAFCSEYKRFPCTLQGKVFVHLSLQKLALSSLQRIFFVTEKEMLCITNKVIHENLQYLLQQCSNFLVIRRRVFVRILQCAGVLHGQNDRYRNVLLTTITKSFLSIAKGTLHTFVVTSHISNFSYADRGVIFLQVNAYASVCRTSLVLPHSLTGPIDQRANAGAYPELCERDAHKRRFPRDSASARETTRPP